MGIGTGLPFTSSPWKSVRRASSSPVINRSSFLGRMAISNPFRIRIPQSFAPERDRGAHKGRPYRLKVAKNRRGTPRGCPGLDVRVELGPGVLLEHLLDVEHEAVGVGAVHQAVVVG